MQRREKLLQAQETLRSGEVGDSSIDDLLKDAETLQSIIAGTEFVAIDEAITSSGDLINVLTTARDEASLIELPAIDKAVEQAEELKINLSVVGDEASSIEFATIDEAVAQSEKLVTNFTDAVSIAGSTESVVVDAVKGAIDTIEEAVGTIGSFRPKIEVDVEINSDIAQIIDQVAIDAHSRNC